MFTVNFRESLKVYNVYIVYNILYKDYTHFILHFSIEIIIDCIIYCVYYHVHVNFRESLKVYNVYIVYIVQTLYTLYTAL